ncbi:MAG: ATP-binding protein [Pseudomonadota bacterium]
MKFLPFPKSLAGQFVLLLVLALLAVNTVAILVLGSERDRMLRAVRRSAQVDRIVTLVPALNAMDPKLRSDVVRAVSGRRTRLTVDPQPRVEKGPAGPVGDAVAAVLGERLDLPQGLQVRIAVRDHAGNRRPPEWGDFRRRRRRILMDLSIPLEDGMWLNSRQISSLPRLSGPNYTILGLLGLSFVAVLGVGLVFIVRLTKPIAALRDAAVQVGRGRRDVQLAETGPAEIKDVSRAFNEMQSEIARFDEDRARTVAAIGHDLRTPITSLRIRAEMLDEAKLRDPMIRTLDDMAMLADGLLAWGRNEAEVEIPSTVDVAALLKGLCDNAEFNAAYDGPTALEITARPTALRRAFSNLLENARRYAGGATVRLARSDSEAQVIVEDDGPGIPAERLATITEPFRRGEESRSRETGGAGLGLSIVQTIIRAHGGRLDLANRQDRSGLIVTVTMPG